MNQKLPRHLIKEKEIYIRYVINLYNITGKNSLFFKKIVHTQTFSFTFFFFI